MNNEVKKGSFWSALGPGILFAGAAIGTSHLVQSTRAGAVYGLGLVGIVLLANLIKYPAFRFGPFYAAATGTSLIDGYALLGRPILLLVALSQFAVQVIIIAATGITTAGILIAVAGLSIDARYLGAVAIVVGAVVLLTGGFKVLDRFTKVFIAVLTVATLVATFSVLPMIEWKSAAMLPSGIDFKTFAFIVALMGFMPSALDLSILHSLWSVAKFRTSGYQASIGEAMLDFNIGYVCSAVLAICFLLMGAGVMYGGDAPASNAGQFSEQIISLYTNSLGEWSGFLVGISALCVMFTTLMTVLDGMPRMQTAAIARLLDDQHKVDVSIERSRLFYAVLLVQAGAAILILLYLMKSFTQFIDFVTITSFIVAPLIALLNHIVATRAPVSEHQLPAKYLRVWSVFGIIVMTSISLIYFVTLAQQ